MNSWIKSCMDSLSCLVAIMASAFGKHSPPDFTEMYIIVEERESLAASFSRGTIVLIGLSNYTSAGHTSPRCHWKEVTIDDRALSARKLLSLTAQSAFVDCQQMHCSWLSLWSRRCQLMSRHQWRACRTCAVTHAHTLTSTNKHTRTHARMKPHIVATYARLHTFPR